MRLIRFVVGQLYSRQDLSVDQLPYTSQLREMARLYTHYTMKPATERDVYLTLQGLRKSGGLPRKRRSDRTGSRAESDGCGDREMRLHQPHG